MADIDLAGLLKRFLSDYSATRSERQNRYGQGVSELSKIVEMFKPGGEFAKKTSSAALNAAKAGFAGAGLGGITPKAMSNSMASTMERTRVGGEIGALTNRAQYKSTFPQISPSPSAITNLATGGFSGLTQQELATAPGGPLAQPSTIQDVINYYNLGGTGYSGPARGGSSISAARYY